MDLENVLERMQPYDKGTHLKHCFFKCLKEFPELEESLRLQLSLKNNYEWISRAKDGEIYFIVNDERWKHRKTFISCKRVTLSLVGPKKVATISIDIY